MQVSTVEHSSVYSISAYAELHDYVNSFLIQFAISVNLQDCLKNHTSSKQ